MLSVFPLPWFHLSLWIPAYSTSEPWGVSAPDLALVSLRAVLNSSSTSTYTAVAAAVVY